MSPRVEGKRVKKEDERGGKEIKESEKNMKGLSPNPAPMNGAKSRFIHPYIIPNDTRPPHLSMSPATYTCQTMSFDCI